MKSRTIVVAALSSVLVAGCSSSNSTAAQDTSASPATSPSTTVAPAAAHGVEAAIETVPWSQVGSGWMLATWSPVSGTRPGEQPPPNEPKRDEATTTLYLIDPAGGRYPITTFPPPGDKSSPDLVDWSGDGSHALFYADGEQPTAIMVDLHTGTQTTLPVNGAPRFTRPDGKALLMVTRSDSSHPTSLKRVDLAGKEQLTYPTDKLGSTFGGSYLSTPDGTRLVLGTSAGLVLVGNDGTIGSTLSIPGQTDCGPVRWWDGDAGTTVLAGCAVGESYARRLWLVPVDGSAPTALTAPNDGQKGPDIGDVNAWQLPAGTFVQALGGCGLIYLAKLNADGTTSQLSVPNTDAHGSVSVIGANGGHLDVQAMAACGPGQSLLDYDPGANTSTFLLGGPVNGGGVITAVRYPDEQ